MKIKLNKTKNGYSLIPEGRYVFKIMDVDESKFEETGRLTIRMQTSDGRLHFENFNLTKNGQMNEKAMNALKYFMQNILGDMDAEEADTADMIGGYVHADVVHRKWTGQDGLERTSESLQNLEHAEGFDDNFDSISDVFV